MGRRLDRNDSDAEFQAYHRGCLLKLFHVFAYDHKSNSKRLVLRRNRSRNPTLCCQNPKTISLERENGGNEHQNDDVAFLQVEGAVTKAMNDVSPKDSILDKLNSQGKELSKHSRSSTIDSRGVAPDWPSPVIILQCSADSEPPRYNMSEESVMGNDEGSRLKKTTSGSRFKDYVDTLEIYQVNKKLFLDMFRESQHQSLKKYKPSAKHKLKRSGSFPVDKSFPVKAYKPRTLEQKLKERFPSGVIPQIGFASESAAPSGAELNERLVADSSQDQLRISEKVSSVMDYIIYLKNKLKRALWHGGQYPRDYSGTKPSSKDGGENLKNGAKEDESEALIKRATSHKEFLENCTQLLESSSRRDASKHQHRSWSLKLGRSDSLLSRAYSLKTFRRRLSMPDLDYFVHYSDASESQSRMAVLSEDNAANGGIDILTAKEDCSKTTAAAIPDELEEKKATESPQGEPTDSQIEEDEDDQSPVSVLVTRFPDEAISNSPGTENLHYGKRSYRTDASAFTAPLSKQEDEDPDSTYVRELLYISGCFDQECIAKWHSLCQVLNPQLFHDLEAILYTRQSDRHSNHRILFDSVNEVLVEIFQSSLAYFPAQFGLTRRARPVPRGEHVMTEVIKKISNMRTCGREFTLGDDWMNLVFDVEDAALDVEDVIFDDLLTEAIRLI